MIPSYVPKAKRFGDVGAPRGVLYGDSAFRGAATRVSEKLCDLTCSRKGRSGVSIDLSLLHTVRKHSALEGLTLQVASSGRSGVLYLAEGIMAKSLTRVPHEHATL